MNKGVKIISHGKITFNDNQEKDYIIYYQNGTSYLETNDKKYELSNTKNNNNFKELSYTKINGKILNTIPSQPEEQFKFKDKTYSGSFKNHDGSPFNQKIIAIIEELKKSSASNKIIGEKPQPQPQPQFSQQPTQQLSQQPTQQSQSQPNLKLKLGSKIPEDGMKELKTEILKPIKYSQTLLGVFLSLERLREFIKSHFQLTAKQISQIDTYFKDKKISDLQNFIEWLISNTKNKELKIIFIRIKNILNKDKKMRLSQNMKDIRDKLKADLGLFGNITVEGIESTILNTNFSKNSPMNIKLNNIKLTPYQLDTDNILYILYYYLNSIQRLKAKRLGKNKNKPDIGEKIKLTLLNKLKQGFMTKPQFLPTLEDTRLPVEYSNYIGKLIEELNSYDFNKHTYLGLFPLMNQLNIFFQENFKPDKLIIKNQNFQSITNTYEYFDDIKEKINNHLLRSLLILLLSKIVYHKDNDFKILEKLKKKLNVVLAKDEFINSLIGILISEELQFIEPVQGKNVLRQFLNNFNIFSEQQKERITIIKNNLLSTRINDIIKELIKIYENRYNYEEEKLFNSVKKNREKRIKLINILKNLEIKYKNTIDNIGMKQQILNNKNLINNLVKSNEINNEKEVELIFLVKLIDTIKSSNRPNKDIELNKLIKLIEKNPLFDDDNKEDIIKYLNK